PARYETEAKRGRRYFRRDDESRECERIRYMRSTSSAQADRHLAFRDYLISHPEVAQAYGDLKRELADRFPSDINAYMDGKDSFVKHYEAEALAWRRDRARG